MVALQLFGINPLGDQILGMVILVLVITLGTYIGVLMALQTFFESSTGGTGRVRRGLDPEGEGRKLG